MNFNPTIDSRQRCFAVRTSSGVTPLSVIVAAIVGILMMGMPNEASPCSRHPWPSSQQLVAEATSVFRGQVSEVVTTTAAPAEECAEGSECGLAKVRFQVLETFKGESNSSSKIEVPQCIACGYCMKAGQEYIVYVNLGGRVEILNGTLLIDEESRADVESELRFLRSLDSARQARQDSACVDTVVNQ